MDIEGKIVSWSIGGSMIMATGLFVGKILHVIVTGINQRVALADAWVNEKLGALPGWLWDFIQGGIGNGS